ncbi:MAG TPA: S-layer homology domain-containing protein, partial [Actinomycetota bacterium]
GDEYEYYLAWQWVDITGIPAGTFVVRSKVDPYGYFTELSESNQCWYTRVSFTSSSNAVTVHGSDNVCLDDWRDTAFAGDIQWAFDRGITAGCAPDLFCSNNRVTREQMASFLVRALGLPPSATDHFVDDNASIHEADINALAASGITGGCGDGRFCPSARVQRGQMASFLVRAFDLPPSSSDFFTDDSASIHEGDINALAASGITAGCEAGRFCPGSPVTRAEMVAFLHRAME